MSTSYTLTRALFVVTLMSLSGGPVLAANVKVDGADVTYPDKLSLDGQQLRLTGTGLRKKFIFNVYTVASYVAASEKPTSAEALAALDAPKRLHLVMERDVDGKTMADAFREALEKNHELKALGSGVGQLSTYLQGKKAKDNDHIIFDHIPGKGVKVSRTGRASLLLPGLAFAKAVWDIYLGPENVSGDIKKGLLKQL